MARDDRQAKFERIISALKEYDPERIILFGSAARGDADEHSDLDIVVVKETDQRFLDRLGTVYELVAPDFALDVLVYTPAEFAEMQAEENPFIEEVLREGVVVYDRAEGAQDHPMPLSAKGGAGMRKKRAEQEGRRWLEQAQADLAAARWNEQGGFHSVACFWSQQTAERALKAYLYFRGKRRVFGHSVLELAEECARLDPEFGLLSEEIALLDRYFIPTHYPNGLPGGVPAKVYKAKEAQQAIHLAEKTVALVARKILPPSSEGKKLSG